MKSLIITILISFLSFSSLFAKTEKDNYYEVSAITKHGFICDFYFKYSFYGNNLIYQSKKDEIHIKIDEELERIVINYTLEEIITNIDSVCFKIEYNLKDHFDIKYLEIYQLGINKSIKEALEKKEFKSNKFKLVELNRFNNHVGKTAYSLKLKSKSNILSLVIFTKYNSEVTIDFVISYQGNNPDNPIDSLNKNINKIIIDSLRQYDMFQMWSTKRLSIEVTILSIIKNYYPEAFRVNLIVINIPKDAKEIFWNTLELKQSLLKTLIDNDARTKLLNKELEINKNLSKEDINNIKEKINEIEDEQSSLNKKLKNINFDFKL